MPEHDHDHGHDDHGHDDHGHHDHPLPPPEPDVYVHPSLYMWGIGTFAVVIVIIIMLGGYFWTELGAGTDGERVAEASILGDGLKVLHATEAERLGTYKKLEDGSYQIPIDQAKALLVREAGAAKP